MQAPSASNLDVLFLAAAAIVIVFGTLLAFASRYKKCPSDRILVVYGKVSSGKSAHCLHGGAAFIWPIIQDYQFLDLTPMPIEINLQGALSKQNIRVNTPSTFTVGVSTEPGVMENAAERMLGLQLTEIKELAKDIIFGQMRVVIATMNIEEINSDRDKLIANIATGVEVELKKVGLRLINVNIQDVTDVSGYIDALGQEAASKAINEARIKVAQADRDGQIGASEAQRDQRIRVANANAEATKGENVASVEIANSNADRRSKEAEALRVATAAEKVASARALEEAYVSEHNAESQRAERDKATQYANVVVPAEIARDRLLVEAEAQAEQTRRTQKGAADGQRSIKQAEADGLLFVKKAEAESMKANLLAQADGAQAILTKKAAGFRDLIETCGGANGAQNMLITEQLPSLVREQVNAISNLKIDKVTVWDSGKNSDGKTGTADFLSGLIKALPPLHELARNAGLDLPTYLGEMQREAERQQHEPGKSSGDQRTATGKQPSASGKADA
jgi:flotillin